ncbi:MAG: hypothetical protein HOH38_10330 [Nitrospinaceae bacterium]|nr:hypothetical protein [Nitrospinaceae bacterium]
MTTFSVELENSFRNKDSSKDELSPPSGLCFTSTGNLLLADDFNHRIQIYDSEFNLLNSFGSKGKEPGQFQYPKGIAVDSGGNIYVADSWNHRIQKFNSEGIHLLSFGHCGEGKGELNEPYDIHIEPSGNLIVVERYNHRIQFFDPQGVSLGWLGDRGTVLEEVLADIQGTPADLLAPPLFELPTSIAQDSQGNYFITDSGNHRIRKFNSRWQEVLSFGDNGSEPGQFQYPLCVSIASNDLLYVADLNNERVQVFSPFGQFLFVIDGTVSGQFFEAPCLTAIDLQGCLYIGFTFNTTLFKYQIPVVSQKVLTENLSTLPNPDPAHIFYQALCLEQENDNAKALTVLEKLLPLLRDDTLGKTSPDLKINILLQFSRLSVNEAHDNSLALACKEAEALLIGVRNETLKHFLYWQDSAQKFTELSLDEQSKIVKNPSEVRDFNRELHIAEQEDKKVLRQTQKQFYCYQKFVQKFSQFICNLIESNLPEAQLKFANDVLLRQTRETLNIMKDYFEQKEKNEESMVRILGESQGEKGRLSAFLSQFHPNGRIIDIEQQLQFELRCHWHTLRTIAHQAPDAVSLENLGGKIKGEPSAFEDVMKVLIGFHEDWVGHPQMEQQLLHTLDTLTRVPSIKESIQKKNLTLADLAPIPYDSEKLDFLEIFTVLKAEALPLSKDKDGLKWGQDAFQFPDLSQHEKELALCANKLMETHITYQEKFRELTQQLEELSQNRKELDTQLKQTHIEDKVSPITINDNIVILQFQINLIRRMILSLEINQSLNLHRLVLAGAFLSLTNNDPTEAHRFFESFDDCHSSLDRQIHEISKSRKENSFKVSELTSQASKLKSEYKITDISDSIKIEEESDRVKSILGQLGFELNIYSRIKNILDKLFEFRNRLSTSDESLKSNFHETRILGKGGAEIGKTLSPYGIHYNQDGDLLIADYENHRVYSYSPQGHYQFHFGGWGNAPTCLQHPVNLACDSENAIYVIDEMNREIKKFDRQGNFLLQFGRGDFGPIFSLSIDSQNHIWVAEPEHNRIRIFDNQGKPLRTLQNENLKNPVSVCCLPNGEYLAGDRSESLLKYFDAQDNLIHETGKTDSAPDEIYFLAWHREHGIFGSDFWNSQIIHLNKELEIQNIYHKPGKRTGQLSKVGGLSTFNDQLAVANVDGGKMQIFDLSSLH